MNPETQDSVIRACLTSDHPILLWGPPGIGKTARVQALAREAGAHLETLIAAQLDPVDVAGMPLPEADGIRLAPPPYAREIRAALDSGRPAWLFLDEISCAPPAVQAALLRVVHERRVDGIDMRGCRVIAAANPSDTAADGGLLSPAMAGRWRHVDITPDLDAWIAGELSGWGQPQSAARAAAAAAITGFLRRSPSALLAVPADLVAAGREWPSPRTWSAAIDLLAVLPGGTGDAAARACVAAAVGAPAAQEWAAWLAAQDLPDPEDLLAGRAKLPTRGDRVYAALGSLAAAALSAHEERARRIDRAWKILSQCRRDIALPTAQIIISGAPDIAPPEAIALGGDLVAARRNR